MDRPFVSRIVTGIALLLWLTTSWSQSLSYPNRPIRLIVPFPPTGAVDPMARIIGQKLTEAWGQPVLVDNRPGGGTIVGTEILAKSAADGYTVILAPVALTVNPAMYTKLPYDPVKDFTPISLIAKYPMMLVVNPKTPVNSVKELTDYLKSKPGQINFSSTGNGTIQHLAGELFQSMAAVSMVHVPYKGSGPSMMGVMAGDVSLTMDVIALLMPQVKAGKLRALAVTGSKRSPLNPNLPTVAETGLTGFEVSTWIGFLAPAGAPREVVVKWHREIERIFQAPEIRERLIAQGIDPVASSPEYFADFIKAEIAKWGGVVRQAGVKLD